MSEAIVMQTLSNAFKKHNLSCRFDSIQSCFIQYIYVSVYMYIYTHTYMYIYTHTVHIYSMASFFILYFYQIRKFSITLESMSSSRNADKQVYN